MLEKLAEWSLRRFLPKQTRSVYAMLPTHWISRALFFAQLTTVLLGLRNWAYVTTYRLYLEQRVDGVGRSTAGQQFDVEGSRVVPRIIMRGPERIAFRTTIDQDSTIRIDLYPSRRARYEIGLREGPNYRVLAGADIETATAVACPYPAGTSVLELASDGAVAWVDPRIVRNLHVGRQCTVLAILLLCSVARSRRQRPATARGSGSAGRLAWFRACTATMSIGVSFLIVEVSLRALGDRLPSGIIHERHDLGEVTRDPRWEQSPRYGRRLRANVDTVNEWRYGDAVRMGYIPPSVSDGTVHRFSFRTDREGFRNPSTRDSFDVAALGDSFTDAMTMAVEASWPMQLACRLGLSVQNYGTAGFGPPQELLVLEDYVAVHRPRLVVLAFFAGNDIFDAEAFERFERSGGSAQRADPGWRIKDIVSRADNWYVVSALRAGATWLAQLDEPRAVQALVPAPDVGTGKDRRPSFDRGMFTVPIGDRLLRWAFMPPYLNTLNFSEQDLMTRQGWALTRRAVTEMQRAIHAFGGEFVVMFLPFKSQVYLPLLERTFSHNDLGAALQFYLDDGRPVDVDAMSRNRLAQNRLMRQLCADAAIPFLDTTDTLVAHVEAGQNMYFPDDSHLNEEGQAVVTEALTAFLIETGLTPPSLPRPLWDQSLEICCRPVR